MAKPGQQFKEFRFYFSQSDFISHFCEPEKSTQYESYVTKEMNDQSVFALPSDELTNQPERFINSRHVMFYVIMDITVPTAEEIEKAKAQKQDEKKGAHSQEAEVRPDSHESTGAAVGERELESAGT